MAGALLTRGLEAQYYLCTELPRYLLKIDPEPEPPPCWEGPNLLYPINNPEDLLRWLHDQEMLESLSPDPQQRQVLADMAILRNAYRLVEMLALMDVPPQPLEQLNVGQLLAALNNLRRAVQAHISCSPPIECQAVTAEVTQENCPQESTASGNAESTPNWRPTSRMRDILRVMYRKELTSRDCSLSRDDIANLVQPGAKGNSFSRQFAALRAREYLDVSDRESGSLAGTYLTESGVQLAQQLENQP